MSAYSATIPLTLTSTGTEYDLAAGQIVSITANGSGSTVTFMDNGATPGIIVVDESPSAINTACEQTVAVTDVNADIIYLAANRFVDVLTFVSGSINAKVIYDAGGATLKNFYVKETRAAIRTAISLIVTAATTAGFAETTVQNEWTVGQVFDAPNFESLAAAVSAHAGGGQGSATALTKRYNNVTTVTTAADSVMLLTAAVGISQTVKNNGATTLAVFPFSGDAINGGSVNASVSINPGDSLTFTATTTSNWETEGIESLDTFFFATDLLGAKEVDHVMSVGTTITAATVGGKLTIVGGAGATSGAGGVLALASGAGGTTGAGGALTITSGAATNATAGTGAASGAITITTGTSATATTGTGGAGATISMTGKAGGAATGAAGIGGAGSAIAILSGAGGAASDAASGNAGAGGAGSLTAGAGGAATGTGGAAGGVGGAAGLVSGAGGASAGTAVAGAGGLVSITAGSGGAKAATGHAAGGAGGSVTVTVGTGGATASDGTDAGGVAGTYTITGGAGGAASAGTGDGGKGSNIVLTPGAGGASAGGTAGLPGFVVTGRAQVKKHVTAAINTTATATALQVANGYITSTSAAAVTITLPTGTLLGAALGAAQGTIFDLFIDNTAGANTVTIAVAVNGILSAAAAANGASQGLLTVPSGVTGQACFRLMFSSATAYTFTRTA